MILDGTCIDVVVQSVKPDYFHRPAHQTLFEALVRMHDARMPIDLVSLREELIRRKLLEPVGDMDYVAALVEGVPNAANAEYYCAIVRKKALLRELIAAGTEIVREAYDSPEDAQHVVDRAEQRIFEIASDHLGEPAKELKNLVDEAFSILETRTGDLITGLPTQYQQLNDLTCGFQDGDMIILAARPSMGKTSLLLNMAEYMGVEEKLPVALFSLEMSAQQIAQRLLCSHARFDMQQMRRGLIGDEAWPSLQASAGDLQQAPILIDDTPTLTILQLRAKARRLKATHHIRCVFVDYLQLMTYVGRADSRHVQIGEISQGVKALARELEIPVVVAAQLNRGPADRPTHRPRMSDLRESGSIEQDADVVMLLHNEDYYHRGEPDYQPTGNTELIIAKQRNGPTDIVLLEFYPQYTRFDAARPDARGG
jgi:replicative DNA helicase